MMQLIVNDVDTAAPGISFPFQSITICKRKKCRKPVTTRNDFMIVTAADLCKSILSPITIIFGNLQSLLCVLIIPLL